MIPVDRFPLVGLARGMVLVVGDFYSPVRRVRANLLLDTGSSITTLTWQVVGRLGLDPHEPHAVRRTHVWGGTQEAPILIVPRVRVFGQEVRDLEVACGDLPPDLKIDGVLGLNFLSHFDLRLNFRKRYIELR
jgi:predicted aspartyl protease